MLDGVTEQMLVSREESFGPIVPIIAASGDDEALRIANADALGLAGRRVHASLERAFRFSQELRVRLGYRQRHRPTTSRTPSLSAARAGLAPAGAASEGSPSCAT